MIECAQAPSGWRVFPFCRISKNKNEFDSFECGCVSVFRFFERDNLVKSLCEISSIVNMINEKKAAFRHFPR